MRRNLSPPDGLPLPDEAGQERLLLLDLVRSTEAAALRAARLMGKGDPDAVELEAAEGMRGMLNQLPFRGRVVIRAGPGRPSGQLLPGERIGGGGAGTPELDVAADPVEGPRLVADGLPNALSVFVAANAGSLHSVRCQYMNKIAVGPRGRGRIDLRAPVRENLRAVAAAMRRKIRDLTVVILNRPRHTALIQDVRSIGARIKLISDGDLAASLAAAMEDSGVDVVLGIGGSAEAVLSAAALRCVGGEIQAEPWFADDASRIQYLAEGHAPEKVFTTEDLAAGPGIILAATGITDGDLLRGARFQGDRARTFSVLMRARTGTIRFIETFHNLAGISEKRGGYLPPAR